MRAFKKVSSETPDLNKVQENVEQALNPVLSQQILNGIMLVNLDLLSGQDNIVQHKLGRRPQGWFVVSPKADTRVWEETSTLPSSNLNLQCSANVTLNLWIF